jgi:hypothetical protein
MKQLLTKLVAKLLPVRCSEMEEAARYIPPRDMPVEGFNEAVKAWHEQAQSNFKMKLNG